MGLMTFLFGDYNNLPLPIPQPEFRRHRYIVWLGGASLSRDADGRTDFAKFRYLGMDDEGGAIQVCRNNHGLIQPTPYYFGGGDPFTVCYTAVENTDTARLTRITGGHDYAHEGAGYYVHFNPDTRVRSLIKPEDRMLFRGD